MHATASYDGQKEWFESDGEFGGYHDVRDSLNHILYMDGELVDVLSKDNNTVTLRNSLNDEEFEVFTISLEQYNRDFVEEIDEEE